MKTIKDGIVFSNDIERILRGNNALNFNYEENGISVPAQVFLQDIRKDFFKEVNEIFDGRVTILSEEEMLEGFEISISDVFRKYPHCIFR